jgi:hypothetical protein
MTREEALQFKKRWDLVDEAVLAELRHTPFELKLHQLASMFVGGNRPENELAQTEKVRDRWLKLKAPYHV